MDQDGFARIRQFVKKYSSALLILLAGILLMLLPTGNKSSPPTVVEDQSNKNDSLQEQLSLLLSKMDGAGRVEVLLTIQNGETAHYQTDSTASGGTDTVVINDSSRGQSGMIQRIDPPKYQGAVILCQGADRPQVQLAITQAVSKATGLGYDKITVLKMK